MKKTRNDTVFLDTDSTREIGEAAISRVKHGFTLFLILFSVNSVPPKRDSAKSFVPSRHLASQMGVAKNLCG
jgi:hypothetical protein